VTSRICRAHDADDPVVDRICGRSLPCKDHPRGCGVARLRPSKQPRDRQQAMFTLSVQAREHLRRLASSRGLAASRVLEDLILKEKA
jgi:hypothetical protein